MAEAIQLMFDLNEITELLIKKQGLHEGLWALSVEFGLAATAVPTTPDGKTLMPASVGIVQRIGIKKHEGEPNNLTVDAAVTNPTGPRRREGGQRAFGKRAKK